MFYVEIYFPQALETLSVETPVGRSTMLTATLRAALEYGGGYTITQATGGWKDDDTGEVIAEPVNIIKVLVPYSLHAALLETQVRALFGRNTHEKAVLIVTIPVRA